MRYFFWIATMGTLYAASARADWCLLYDANMQNQHISENACRQQAATRLTKSPKNPLFKRGLAQNLVGGFSTWWCQVEVVNPDRWTTGNNHYEIVPAQPYVIGFQGNWGSKDLASGLATFEAAWTPKDKFQYPDVPAFQASANNQASFRQEANSVRISTASHKSGEDELELEGKVNLKEGTFVGTFRNQKAVYGVPEKHLVAGNFKCTYLGVQDFQE